MSEKNMRYSLLLDFYGDILSDNQREMMEYYYNEDLSLSEIADEVGITRQGVRDAVRRAEETLSHLEEKLGMAARFDTLRQQRAEILSNMEALRGLCGNEPEKRTIIDTIQKKLQILDI